MDIQTPDFKAFYHSLDPAQRQAFAEAAGTTTGYIEVHLVRAARIPRKDKMDALWGACQRFGANFSRSDLIQFFFNAPAKGGPVAEQEPTHV
ncbi:hypothetical protein [Bordetella petrii]|uniref:hypothetical protein n=1 Tax=Bordetella petrii TaxID=94624 RepID=UPI0004BB9043|nr:hypothetical protein [Bordetella petrii]